MNLLGYSNLNDIIINIDDIIESVSSITDRVHFASVCFYHPKQKNNQDVLPLYRGHGAGMKFSGLSIIS